MEEVDGLLGFCYNPEALLRTLSAGVSRSFPPVAAPGLKWTPSKLGEVFRVRQGSLISGIMTQLPAKGWWRKSSNRSVSGQHVASQHVAIKFWSFHEVLAHKISFNELTHMAQHEIAANEYINNSRHLDLNNGSLWITAFYLGFPGRPNGNNPYQSFRPALAFELLPYTLFDWCKDAESRFREMRATDKEKQLLRLSEVRRITSGLLSALKFLESIGMYHCNSERS